MQARGNRGWLRRGSVAAVVAAIGVAGGALHAASGPPAASAGSAPLPVTGDAKVDGLIAKLTLDEKLALLEGAQEPAATNQYEAGYLPGVPRLGIPSLRLSDGPPGTATKEPSVGMTQTMGVAATFSQHDAQQNGVVIGRDARALGIDVTLQPFVNMLRDPTWGRAFNVFGEDPLLTGQTAAAEIQGIQSQGVMAQVKHFIAYDGANNVVVDARTLHEIYLEPFTDAVNAGVASVMCSYNFVNGPYSCGSTDTLTGILRNELGFKGFVTSDWGANHATTFINAGLDMEMPGGGLGGFITPYFAKQQLETAIANGSVSLDRVDQAVGHILYEEDRFGLLDGGSKHDVTPEPVNADERVVQSTGQDAAVLLKDDGGALPLSSTDLSSLALIGPGAGQTMATNGTGEDSGGLADRQIGTYQVLQQKTAGNPDAHISYAVADDMTGTPVPAANLSHDGQPGLLRTDTATGATSVDSQLDSTRTNGNPLPAGSSWTWTGTLTVPADGSYSLYAQGLGGNVDLNVDGNDLGSTGGFFFTLLGHARYGTVKPVDDGPLPTTDLLANFRAHVHLTAGDHTIKVTETPDVSNAPVQVRLNWVTPAQQQANHDAAVSAARSAHTAVVFAWSGGSLNAPLPEGQGQLIEDVAAANPNTIVVLNSNLPVAMPWLSSVRAVVEMWFPGDSGGEATANVLLGKVNPGGRLPFTWPQTLDQGVANQPATHPERTSAGVHPDGTLCTTPAADCTTTYSEGIFIGYRWFDQQGLDPLYPFGYGLSYTSFAYSGLSVKRSGDGGLDVTFNLRNTGSVRGDEVPQVYLGAPDSPPTGVSFAPRSLAAYDRVTLDPGQGKQVQLHVPARQLQYWSTTAGWTTVTGTRPVYVAASSRDVRLTGSVDVTG